MPLPIITGWQEWFLTRKFSCWSSSILGWMIGATTLACWSWHIVVLAGPVIALAETFLKCTVTMNSWLQITIYEHHYLRLRQDTLFCAFNNKVCPYIMSLCLCDSMHWGCLERIHLDGFIVLTVPIGLSAASLTFIIHCCIIFQDFSPFASSSSDNNCTIKAKTEIPKDTNTLSW